MKNEPNALPGCGGCLAMFLGVTVLLFGFAFALEDMGIDPNHKMSSDLPWAKHPFILIPLGFILVAAGGALYRQFGGDLKALFAHDPTKKADLKGADFLQAQMRRLLDTPESGNTDIRLSEQNDELRRLVSDPTKLDGLSAEQLDDLRLILEVRLEASQRDFTAKDKEFLDLVNDPETQMRMSMPIYGDIIKQFLPDTGRQKQELIDNLNVLIRLIRARQARLAKVPEKQLSPPTPIKGDERKEILDEIDSLRSLRNSRREKMRLESATDEEIRRFENMIDNAIHLREAKLEKLLLK